MVVCSLSHHFVGLSVWNLIVGVVMIGVVSLLMLPRVKQSTELVIADSNQVNKMTDGYGELTSSPSELARSFKYVAITPGSLKGRGIGNQLFFFSAQLHVAQLTGKRIVLAPTEDSDNMLDKWFNITDLRRLEEPLMKAYLCPPCVTINEFRALTYDSSMSQLSERIKAGGDLVDANILLNGFFQSWRYTVGIESELRKYLRPQSWLSDDVERFVEKYRIREVELGCNVEPPHSAVFGIHVRAGDIRRKFFLEQGYTIPDRPYSEKAMRNLTNTELVPEKTVSNNTGSCRRRVTYVITSDDKSWCEKHIDFESIAVQIGRERPTLNINVVYSVNKTSGFDFVLLSRCDAVIISTGTFGWWAAWLANKTTIYYQNWPRPGSFLAGQVETHDFFPLDWIPIDGPFVTPVY